MRTTINLGERLLAEAKLLAHRSGTTLTAVIEDAVRERLARRESSGQGAEPFRLLTFTGNGLQVADRARAILRAREAGLGGDRG